MTGEAAIANAWTVTHYTKYAYTCHAILSLKHAISNHYDILQKFQESSAFLFDWINGLKIKVFLEFHFSQTLVFTGFFIDHIIWTIIQKITP